MKKFTLIFTALMYCFSVYSQFKSSDPFEPVISQWSDDEDQVLKLTEFRDSGIEFKLELGDITADDLIKTAKDYLGTPHCMGGTTKQCIDCSGLLWAVFNDLGIEVPHGSQEMARYGEIITDKESLLPGDLVFFTKTYSTDKVITHSGFYTGDGKWIHTSSSKGVEIINLDSPYYWNDKYLFATRIF